MEKFQENQKIYVMMIISKCLINKINGTLKTHSF